MQAQRTNYVYLEGNPFIDLKDKDAVEQHRGYISSVGLMKKTNEMKEVYQNYNSKQLAYEEWQVKMDIRQLQNQDRFRAITDKDERIKFNNEIQYYKIFLPTYQAVKELKELINNKNQCYNYPKNPKNPKNPKI